QRRVWNVALVLFELAGREQATRRHQHLVQLVYHRGLADPGIAGHEHELQGAARHDPMEGSKQSVDLTLPAVELLRHQQTIRYVPPAEREGFDPAMRLPFRHAASEISLDTGGSLVALLGDLGEKLHY